MQNATVETADAIVALVREGDPLAALEPLLALVKRNPADAKLRVFLFQLMLVLGQWERASSQLEALQQIDDAMAGLALMYRGALVSEPKRAKVLAGDGAPVILGQPASWIALLLQALRFDAAGRSDQASALRSQATEEAPVAAGMLNETPFSLLLDADCRFGPVLEAFAAGDYYWIPFARIQRMTIEQPSDLRDAVWLPAQLLLENGAEMVALIPARYPATEAQRDGALLLARRTDWQSVGEHQYRGLGARMLATDVDDYALMDLRELKVDRQP